MRSNRRRNIFILILTIFVAMNFYVERSLFLWLVSFLPYVPRFIFSSAYAFIALTIILGRLSQLPASVRTPLSFIASFWLGIFIYLMLFFLTSDIVVLAGIITRLIPFDMLLTTRFYARTTAIILTTCVFCYGLYNASRFKHVSYDIHLKTKLPKEINIVFISDIHLGSINSENRLESIVKGINDLNPDIVCIVGDIFNDSFSSVRKPEEASALFKSIKAAYGVYAVFGNHDGGSTLLQMMEFLDRSNVKLLNDEYVIIDNRLILVGRLDSSPIGGFGDLKRKPFADIIAGIDAKLPVVVMDHNPARIGEYESNVDLIICGHTHRGQMFPGSLVTRRLYEVDYGHLLTNNDVHVIVSQGVHTWMMPVRIGTFNEIVSVLVR